MNYSLVIITQKILLKGWQTFTISVLFIRKVEKDKSALFTAF